MEHIGVGSNHDESGKAISRISRAEQNPQLFDTEILESMAGERNQVVAIGTSPSFRGLTHMKGWQQGASIGVFFIYNWWSLYIYVNLGKLEYFANLK